MRRWIASLVLIPLLAACGGIQAPEADRPPGAARTASPAPTALTMAQAKARYLKIVAPYNRALEALETAANTGKPWTTVRTLAGKVVEANAAHAEQLRATAWPKQVRPAMAALLAETDAAQRYWQQAAEAKTAEELGRAIRAAAAHSGAKQAGEVRARLGLPPYKE